MIGDADLSIIDIIIIILSNSIIRNYLQKLRLFTLLILWLNWSAKGQGESLYQIFIYCPLCFLLSFFYYKYVCVLEILSS